MKNFTNQFESFMADLEGRVQHLGFSLTDYPIDHVAYRCATLSSFEELKKVFAENSVLHAEKFYHERTFCTFVLRKPLQYKDVRVHCLEFAQPGGSDAYDEGFQHIEFHTNKSFDNIVADKTQIKDMWFTSKHDSSEVYLKWPDKVCIKITSVPILTKALTEDNPRIFVTQP